MITSVKKFTMDCHLCKSIATSTSTGNEHAFVKWARNLGWQVCKDGTTYCSLHRTRKSPLPPQGPVQLDLFQPDQSCGAEEAKKW